MPSEPQAPPPLPPFTPQPVAAAPTAESVFIAAQDGLRLHVREHGRRTGGGLPIVCLPGLSRTCEDFDVLASALAADAYSPRRVLAIDYRGRGRSGYDNPDRYTPTVELGDLITILTALEVAPAMFIGTSRGGILTMLLAAARPTAIAGAVLNDIGPVIELKGLMRIKSYVGRLPQPRSIEEGADILRRLFDAQFPDQPPPVWIAAARRAWRERNGRLYPTFDPLLRRTLAAIRPEQPLPSMWAQFDALARAPTMVIRGANSDVLSAATVGEMRARQPDLLALEVPGQGHAPFLAEPDIIRRIAAFAGGCERAAH